MNSRCYKSAWPLLRCLLGFSVVTCGCYLSEFEIGLTKVTGKTKQAVKNKDEIDAAVPPVAPPAPPPAGPPEVPPEAPPVGPQAAPPAGPHILANEAVTPGAPSTLDEFLPAAKKVLRTLWKFQVEQFGPDDIGHGVSPLGRAAPDYQEFNLGITQLLMRGLVFLGYEVFVFLTEAGIDFCKQYNKQIVSYPFYYSNFSN